MLQHPLFAPLSSIATAPPNVHIYPVSPENTLAPVMLACDVRDFYPRKVSVVWLRNGVPVKTEPEAPAVSNGDWTYQAQVTLPVDPQRGDTYTCSVKHTSLPEPVTKDWGEGGKDWGEGGRDWEKPTCSCPSRIPFIS